MIVVGPDTKGTKERLAAVAPLTIHTLCRPLDPDEPVPRENPLALNKLLAEGGLSEVKIILGWEINTRTLTIALPLHKHTTWDSEIKNILTFQRCKTKALECLIGRLNHAGFIIPSARHFLSRIRLLHQRNKYKRENNIPATVREDLNF